MKTLPFRDDMTAAIRTGRKTATSRTKKYGEVGDVLATKAGPVKLTRILCIQLREVAHTDVICLTGSTRFWQEYQDLFRAFSLQGKIVLTVAFPTSEGASEVTDEQKEMLDELHLRKIDLADCIYVINVDGYIGESTAKEIEYAESKGKPVYYHETSCARESKGGEDG